MVGADWGPAALVGREGAETGWRKWTGWREPRYLGGKEKLHVFLLMNTVHSLLSMDCVPGTAVDAWRHGGQQKMLSLLVQPRRPGGSGASAKMRTSVCRTVR